MVRNTVIASLLASSAVVLAATTPAHAGETERAREAISAADARIHTAESLGAGVELPAATADARAALATAREHFADGHRDEAIQDAIHASALADTAIGEVQRRKDNALASAQAAAHDTAANAQDQVTAAQQQAAEARQQAQDANARANAAEQSAAQSAQEADAARTAAATAQVDTTVTTQHQGATHHTRTHVVRRTTTATPSSNSSDSVTTTTRVTPQQ